jgi:hypothetical protein
MSDIGEKFDPISIYVGTPPSSLRYQRSEIRLSLISFITEIEISAILVDRLFSLAGKIKDTCKDRETAIAGLNGNMISDVLGIVFSCLNNLIATLKGRRTPVSLTAHLMSQALKIIMYISEVGVPLMSSANR